VYGCCDERLRHKRVESLWLSNYKAEAVVFREDLAFIWFKPDSF